MAMKYLAFDIEILRPIPDGAGDWKSFRPLGISCAGTLTSDKELNVWHGAGLDGAIEDPELRVLQMRAEPIGRDQKFGPCEVVTHAMPLVRCHPEGLPLPQRISER